MGNFDFSNLDDRSIRDNYNKLESELSKMENFLQEVDNKWQDDQKKAFFIKYLHETMNTAKEYIRSYDDLVEFINQKKNKNPNFY
jgi:uncharacterized protein YukE